MPRDRRRGFTVGSFFVVLALTSPAANFQGSARTLEGDGRGGHGRTSSPERLDVRGIENVYRLSPTLYSGGQPEGAEAFSALKDLGIRTILTVDGSRPDVEA